MKDKNNINELINTKANEEKIENNISPKVSIIVPIYNVEKYLRQCLDSIVNQTLKDIEIILVDDGSTDSCPSICDEYASKDKRIIVIHKENKGLGAAYNTGLDIAKGEYIGFVESDDWIESNMYEELYNKAVESGSDLVKCMFYKYNSKAKKKSIPYKQRRADFELDKCTKDSAFKINECKKLLIYHSSIWASLYKKDFVSNLRFQESKGASYQDFPFMMEALMLAKSISAVKKRLYHYRLEECNQASMNKTDKSLFKMIEQCEYSKQRLISLGVFDDIKEEFYSHAISPLFRFYYRIQDDLKPLFFDNLVKFFKDFHKENMTYKYLQEYEKHFLSCILSNDFSKTLIYEYAVDRVKNHLSYKIGKAIINADTFFKRMILPLKVSSIILTHKMDRFIFKAICRANPALKLPAIDGYADFYKALQLKKTNTYKLGQFFLKNPWRLYLGLGYKKTMKSECKQ
ncbi:glycosyltransferase [uncultured Campylobacter sp.]|uniref:glycosyltransferase family 2 protein n=1 Tax=uncultured Campylobacter sp. TaxID=218934 RepID=UPI00260EC426|nr:glycosyltransferase [uncultured Campylobacter sp.]